MRNGSSIKQHRGNTEHVFILFRFYQNAYFSHDCQISKQKDIYKFFVNEHRLMLIKE